MQDAFVLKLKSPKLCKQPNGFIDIGPEGR